MRMFFFIFSASHGTQEVCRVFFGQKRSAGGLASRWDRDAFLILVARTDCLRWVEESLAW
jgi:hypothetical protein